MQLQAHKHKYLYIITVQCNNKLPDNSNNNKRRKIQKPKTGTQISRNILVDGLRDVCVIFA